MKNLARNQTMLSGTRALDVTNHRGWLCGRILADLGVDVIKIESPEAHSGLSRDTPDKEKIAPEQRLTWLAYNLGKRCITLNLENTEGKEIFNRLARNADFLLESFPPSHMDNLGLGYDVIREINRGIIFSSISPFGKSGPLRDYKASDIVIMAMGGFMYVTGDPDRSPLRISFPVAYALASTQAALASMIAFHHRKKTGRGQHVDVSAQETVVNTLTNVMATWELNGILTRRVGPLFFRSGLGQEAHQRVIWPCRDGAIAFMAMGGRAGARSNQALAKWMEEEGMANDFIRSIDWNAFDTVTMSKEFHHKVEEPIKNFFKAHTRQDLHDGACQRGIFMQLVATPEDIVESQQLAARDFWIDVSHPEIDKVFKYPGVFARASESPLQPGQRAPKTGEHNTEIYRNELGFSPEELKGLKAKGVI